MVADLLLGGRTATAVNLGVLLGQLFGGHEGACGQNVRHGVLDGLADGCGDVGQLLASESLDLTLLYNPKNIPENDVRCYIHPQT